MIKLENWFKKFKSEAAYVYDSKKTDLMLLDFYSCMDSLFHLFLKIWGAIKKNTIDFSVIEPMYIQAISKYNKLESKWWESKN